MTERKALSVLVVALFCFGLVLGCTYSKQITTTDQLIFMYKTFNAQYEDYLSMAKRTDLSEEQKVMMRKKKPVLEKLQKLIPAYDMALTTGTVKPDQKQVIFDLLNSL